MTTTETWWEEIFEGNLSLGIDKDRIDELDEESFLYFEENNCETEQQH